MWKVVGGMLHCSQVKGRCLLSTRAAAYYCACLVRFGSSYASSLPCRAVPYRAARFSKACCPCAERHARTTVHTIVFIVPSRTVPCRSVLSCSCERSIRERERETVSSVCALAAIVGAGLKPWCAELDGLQSWIVVWILQGDGQAKGRLWY